MLHAKETDERIGVIMAEDDEGLRRLLGDYLEGESDMHLMGAHGDGIELIEALGSQSPDVLLLDVVMPRLDGIGVLERLRERGETPPPSILVLSAFGQEKITRRAGQLGADYFLLKPFDLEVLGRRIREAARGDAGSCSGMGRSTASLGEGANPYQVVTEVIRSVGIPPNIRGYRYLRSAVLRAVEDLGVMEAVTKELYPAVAEEFRTTPTRVERAIRHAIESACNRGHARAMSEGLGFAPDATKGKPTNSEFIALVADHIRMARHRSP